jgi:hypothetical protein
MTIYIKVNQTSFQLILQSELRYFCKGAIVADSREDATGLMVVTAGQVGPPPTRKGIKLYQSDMM